MKKIGLNAVLYSSSKLFPYLQIYFLIRLYASSSIPMFSPANTIK